jgi:hypothetical protein
MAQREYHVVIDRDDDGNWVYNLTQPNGILRMLVANGLMAHWSFVHAVRPDLEYVVYVYHGLSQTIPKGENQEEINQQAIVAILRQGRNVYG